MSLLIFLSTLLILVVGKVSLEPSSSSTTTKTPFISVTVDKLTSLNSNRNVDKDLRVRRSPLNDYLINKLTREYAQQSPYENRVEAYNSEGSDNNHGKYITAVEDPNPLIQNVLFRERRLKLDNILDSNSDLFIPNRGKKWFSGNGNGGSDGSEHHIDIRNEKKARLEDVLSSDSFFPNRGKKEMPRKTFLRMAINDELMNRFAKRNNDDFQDLFVPNRGKKKYGIGGLDISEDDFFPNRGKKNDNLDSVLNHQFFPNRGKKDIKGLFDEPFYPNRGKKSQQHINPTAQSDITKLHTTEDHIIDRRRRDLLDSLSDNRIDSFYGARGRRTGPVEQDKSDYIDHQNTRNTFLIPHTIEQIENKRLWDILNQAEHQNDDIQYT